MQNIFTTKHASVVSFNHQKTDFFLKEVLSVLEGAKLELFILVLQLLLRGSEVEN